MKQETLRAETLPETETLTPVSSPRDNHATALAVWRVLFVMPLLVLGGYLGYQFALLIVRKLPVYRDALGGSGELGASLGFTAIGVLLIYLLASAAFTKLVQSGEHLKEMQPHEKLAMFAGIAAGLLLTLMLFPILSSVPHLGFALTVLVGIISVYLGLVATTSMKEELRSYLPSSAAGKNNELSGPPERCKILDTNVIIDGRVADICRTGFIEGPIYVPGFVLDELQHIADSADALKRARGRRGLDILNQMQSEMPLAVRAYDNVDPGDHDPVDAKLVKLAKQLGGLIVTNDFNLNKVAELQGVQVLNINELANAVKPVVLPGEEMSVQIIKEGKEINQGVAYLEDGTMIVVEGGRRHIGETLDVITSSVFQTAAGKMIFASIREEDEEDDAIDRNLRAYPRRRRD